MSNHSLITPPPELVEQWCVEAEAEHQPTMAYSMVNLVATKAVQWGADQELEACCEWFTEYGWSGVAKLRAARRPKPPSLKEVALAVLDDCADGLDGAHENVLRRALEALDD